MTACRNGTNTHFEIKLGTEVARRAGLPLSRGSSTRPARGGEGVRRSACTPQELRLAPLAGRATSPLPTVQLQAWPSLAGLLGCGRASAAGIADTALAACLCAVGLHGERRRPGSEPSRTARCRRRPRSRSIRSSRGAQDAQPIVADVLKAPAGGSGAANPPPISSPVLKRCCRRSRVRPPRHRWQGQERRRRQPLQRIRPRPADDFGTTNAIIAAAIGPIVEMLRSSPTPPIRRTRNAAPPTRRSRADPQGYRPAAAARPGAGSAATGRARANNAQPAPTKLRQPQSRARSPTRCARRQAAHPAVATGQSSAALPRGQRAMPAPRAVPSHDRRADRLWIGGRDPVFARLAGSRCDFASSSPRPPPRRPCPGVSGHHGRRRQQGTAPRKAVCG